MPNPAELKSLLERVRAATGPDQEIDGQVASLLLAAKIERFMVLGEPMTGAMMLNGEFLAVPAYTSSLDAAVGLVERCFPRWEWYVNRDGAHVGDVVYFADVWDGMARERSVENYHDSPALALIAALLQALIAKAEAPGA